jgi:hypothetical protein
MPLGPTSEWEEAWFTEYKILNVDTGSQVKEDNKSEWGS